MLDNPQKKKDIKIAIAIVGSFLLLVGITSIFAYLQMPKAIEGHGTVTRERHFNDPTGDSGSSMAIRDDSGEEFIVQTGGVYAVNETCGALEQPLPRGARVSYRLLENHMFCSYDGTSMRDTYIKRVD